MIQHYVIVSSDMPTRGKLYRLADKSAPRLNVWCIFGKLVRPGIVEMV